ncbi:MAG: type I 3-dehydroquinate dehydratase [Euryarchaeota archaeon]|nr:type I 3-dehydroquinate dehydratase [Euryarchaeota archaeon]MBU4607565.1 type I 3-dehydroquinate dehydratase [Euryarchaeota archaeon]MBV1729923.1 type I 3-dehydroquinate dehydratase [Methanobacterium sp.]MBV1754302.1 type I 3-dehydroquinate dehydratase [Methanobacterium sp.]MBV1767218.1 type I 3-dehydroquinate dehydratase [Methanobacterium sp.]
MENDIQICVPVFEKTPQRAVLAGKSYQKKGADLLELRIDALENPTPEMIEEILGELELPVIATNRVESEGGYFKGSEEERIELLLVASSQAHYLDIELKTTPELRQKVVKSAPKSIISFHDFKRTPSIVSLRKIVEEELSIGDIAKFAVMPHNMEDTLRVLKIIQEYPSTLGLAMGDYGKYTRVVGPLFGAPFTFASGNKATAPGQMDISTTRMIIEELI